MLESLKSWGSSSGLQIVLGPQRVALVLQPSGWRSAPTVVAQWQPDGTAAPAGAAELTAILDGLLTTAAVRRLPTRIVLADSLVRTWTVEPPRNASRYQDCEAAVHMRFQQVFDEPLADWQLSFDAEASQPFLACALRRSVVSALAAVLAAHQLTLLALEPEFVLLWNHWQRRLPAGAWWGLCQDTVLTLGRVQSGRLVALRRLPLPQASSQALIHTVQHEANRWQQPVPTRLGLCGAPPRAWLGAHAGAFHAELLGPHHQASALWGLAP